MTNKQIRKATVPELIFRLQLLHTASNNRPTCAGVPVDDITDADSIIFELKKRFLQILFLRFQDGGLHENL